MASTSKHTSSRVIRTVRRHPVVLVTAILTMTVVGWLGWPRVAGRVVEVVTMEPKELVQTVMTTGRVRPRTIQLAALTAGEVIELGTREGEAVSAGALLLRLDDREQRAQLEEARARLGEAGARVRQVDVVGRSEAAETVARARTRLDEARRELVRTEALRAADATTDTALEQARTAVELAESELRAARTQQQDVARGGSRARSAGAAREQAAAAVALAEARLGRTRIEAAVDAVVTTRHVEVGDVVQAGAPLFDLVATGATELVIEPDERNLRLLSEGQPALASAEAFPDRTFAAVVDYIAPTVDARRGTIEVRLAVPSPPAYLRPDMTVSVEIEVARRADALSLPIEAVRDLAGEPWVLIAREGRALRREVEIGLRGDERVEIIAGLTRDDRVIVDAGRTIEAGARVRVDGAR